MKHVPVLLMLMGFLTAPAVFAEKVAEPDAMASEGNDMAVSDLCRTYAAEDGIAADKLDAYLSECMAGITDLSEGIQETLPLTAENPDEPAAAPTSAAVNSDPEQMVKSELVETPDPDAEQLDTGKN